MSLAGAGNKEIIVFVLVAPVWSTCCEKRPSRARTNCRGLRDISGNRCLNSRRQALLSE